MLLLVPIVLLGQAPPLGSASNFALFTAAGAFSNDGLTVVTGDIGTNVGAFAGFPPGIVNGTIYVADPVTAQAAADVELAYGSFGGITCDLVLGTTLGNNQVLSPAVFCLGGASTLNGDLILDGGCDPNAFFIFKIDGALSTTSFSNIILTNSASLCNVYWQINGAVSLGVNSSFQGNIVANGAISILEGASLHGRGLSRAGAIDLHNNIVDFDMQPTASTLVVGGPVVFCQGDSVVLSGNCGGVWSNGATTPTITVTTSGTYFITNTNACGGATSNIITVTVNPLPDCLIIGDDPICEGQTTALCVAAGLSSYSWSTGATINCIAVSAAGTYSVTVVDGDGCSSSCSKTITVSPLPSCTITGATTICEGETTELCTPAGAGSYLWNTGATTNCITVGAAGTYSVVVTGANGCTSACSITVSNVPGPSCTITGATTICEGETTELCTPAGAGSYLWNTGATTNCITVGAAGTYSVVVTDANGCTSACSILVIIEQVNTPPVITCPADLTIECDAISLPPNTGTATATDICDQVPPIPTFTDLISGGNCPEISIITRTWTATNTSGNSINCTQTITVIDGTAPTIVCPANLTVDCDASTLPPGTGTPIATDNCDTAPIIGFTDATTGGVCPQEFTIQRTWVATDACGNSSSCTQNIITSDNNPPVVVCPASLTVACDAGILPINTGTATATDNCNPAPLVVYNDATTPGTCPQSFTIARTWTASDGCGNTSSCNQILTVGDLVPPAIVCPTNMVVPCAEQVPVANPALVAATDNCSGPITVSFLGENIANQTCENQYVLTRTYRAVDACGNAAICAQTITVFDGTPPNIAFVNPLLVPGGTINVQCFGQDPAWNLPAFDEGSILVSDICAGEIAVTYNEVLEQTGNCEVDGFINRYRLTWTATDVCGNSSTAFVFLALIDTIAPTIVGVPDDISINCDEIPEPPVIIVGEDECLCACILAFEESVTVPGCQDGQLIVRSWTAKDQCGNQTTVTQNIELIDNEGPTWFVTTPEIMGITGDTILEYPCSDGFPAYLDFLNEESVMMPNTCGASFMLDFQVGTLYAGNCEQVGYTEQRTYHWTAVDACGNKSSLTIQVRLTDQEPPVIAGILPMACLGDTLNLTTATDNCGVLFMTFQDTQISSPCGSGMAVQRTYEAKDGCGNIATATSILLPDDNLAPQIWFTNPVLEELGAGQNLTMDCAAYNGQYTSFGINDVGVADGCTVGLTVNFTEILITAGDCATNGSVAVIQLRWTATDICGNLSELVVMANIVDETSPVFVNFPAEITIACNDELPEFLITDNCGEVTTTTWDTIITSDCIYEYDLLRTITATDLCGNTTTKSQTVHVGDGGGPVISGVLPVVCDDLSIPVVTAFDACAGAFVAVFMEEDTLQVSCGGLVLDRTWSATGICGNETIVHQSIIINDTTPPVIIIPDFSFILLFYGNANNFVFLSETALIDQLNGLNTGSVTVLNGCGEVVLTVTTTYAPDCYILGYSEQRRYTWTATDDCGNTASISFVVNIMDDIPPVFVEVSHESLIVCAELPLAPIMVTEGESQPVKIVYTELIEPGGEPGEYRVTRTWVATDACGNVSVYTQVIKWIPDSFLECSIIEPDSVYCNTHGIVINSSSTGGNGPLDYDWEIVGEDCFIQGGQGTPEINIYVGWTDAKIILTVTDEYDCVSVCTTTMGCQFSSGKSLDEPIALPSPIAANDTKQDRLREIALWPNPANSSVNLGFESSVEDMVELSVSNFLGKVVFTDKIKALKGFNTRKLDMTRVREGSYLVQLKTNQEVHTKVVVIMHSN